MALKVFTFAVIVVTGLAGLFHSQLATANSVLGGSPATCSITSAVGDSGCGASWVYADTSQNLQPVNYDTGLLTFQYKYDVVSAQTEQVNATLTYDLALSVESALDAPGLAHASASISAEDAAGSFNESISASSRNGLCLGNCFGTGFMPVTIPVVTNTVYTVLLSAEAGVQQNLPNFATNYAWAFADPSISVDPSVCPDCTVEVSPGAVNQVTTPVPLPPATWLLLSGLTGLGVLIRKRHAT